MRTVLAEVDPVPRPKHDSRFPHAAAYALVVAKIPSREAEHPRLNPGTRRDVQCLQPLAVRVLAVSRQVLSDVHSLRPGIIISYDNNTNGRAEPDDSRERTDCDDPWRETWLGFGLAWFGPSYCSRGG